MVKINTAWFAKLERGRFAGIYGFMINLGRFGIFTFGPALLAGFTFLWMWQVPPLHWRWLFWAPSIVCALVAICMALTVKETPEEAGFHGVHAGEEGAGTARRVQTGRANDRDESDGVGGGVGLRLHWRGAASGGPVVSALTCRSFTTWT